MTELHSSAERYQLGDWLIDPAANVLSRGDDKRNLRAKAMELLLLLMQRPNETVSREEIVDKIWGGNDAVAAQGINNAIWSIRQALDDDADAPRYLLTVPKKGYRLIAQVQPVKSDLVAANRNVAQPAETQRDPRAPGRGRQRQLLWSLAIFALLTVIMFVMVGRSPTPLSAPQFRNIQPLSSYPGMEYLGQLSPDGQLLAFAWWQSTGKGILYLRRAHEPSAELVRVSDVNHDVVSLSWSGDGNRLAFTALDGVGRCQVSLYSLHSQRTETLADCVAVWTPTLAWSPVADQLVYTGRLSDNTPAGLLLHDLVSGKKRQLTAHDGLLADHQPAWSPDGRQLAFVRSEKSSGRRDIHVSDLQGNLRQLTKTGMQDLHGITWRHDGKALIYSTTLHGSRVLWQLDLASGQATPLGLEGSAPQAHASGLLYSLFKKHQRIGQLVFEAGRAHLQPLAGGVISEQSPDFSPAQQALVFVSARSGHRELWRADADGQNAQQLTHSRRLVQRPRWSPDGKSIAFVGACEPARYGVCLLDVATGKVLTLNTDAEDYETPVWRDDGLVLYVIAETGEKKSLWQLDRDRGSKPLLTTAEEITHLQKRQGQPLLYYLTRSGRQLRQFDPATGTEQTPAFATEWPSNVVAWLPLPDGVLLLQREQSEMWLQRRAGQADWQVLSEFPLGTFAEFPTLTMAGNNDRLYLELADTAYADLMLARE